MRRGAVNGLARRREGLVAALFGALYFVLRTDVRLLDPRRVELLDTSDYAFHVIAAQFYREDVWHWPLTRMTNYFWPVGTSTVYTDANPWLALFTKLLVPASVPPLQTIGGWLFLCFVLQGYFGARLCRLVTNDWRASAAGGCLFVLTPALLARLGHDTLCAHWLLLAAMTEALRPARPTPAALARLAAILSFAAGLHPTLFAMTLTFAPSVVVRSRPDGWRRMVPILGCALGPALVLVAFGTLRGSTKAEAGGFGEFSANLLGLLDPQEAGRSRFFPVLAHEFAQYEGFAFLGAGVLALLLAGIVARRWRMSPPRLAWALVFVPAVACAVYALSSRIFLGHRLLVDVSAIYAPFHAVTNAFRSSGRFVWPLVYAVVLVAIAGVASLPRRWGAVVLTLATVVQAVDTWDIVDPVGLFRPGAPPSTDWSLAEGDYDAILLDPADIESNGFRCPDAHYAERYFLPLARAAAAHRLVFNSGQAARVNQDWLGEVCRTRIAARARHDFDPRAIYAPSADVTYGPEDGMRCGTLDGRVVCVRDDRPTRFRDRLAR